MRRITSKILRAAMNDQLKAATADEEPVAAIDDVVGAAGARFSARMDAELPGDVGLEKQSPVEDFW
jgi:hypothetical protein